MLAVAFLIGGLDAVLIMRQSVVSNLVLNSGNTVGKWTHNGGGSSNIASGSNEDIPSLPPSVDKDNGVDNSGGRGDYADDDRSSAYVVDDASTTAVFAKAFSSASSSPLSSFNGTDSGGEEKCDPFPAGGETTDEDDDMVSEHVNKMSAMQTEADCGSARFSAGGSIAPDATEDSEKFRRSARPTVVDVPRRSSSSRHVSVSGHACASTATAATVVGLSTKDLLRSTDGRANGRRGSGIGSDAAGKARTREEETGCCGLGPTIKRWMSRLPLDKLKILVVVWQILTVFPSIAAVEYPPSYARFLAWIDVVNVDVGQFFSATCLLPAVNHFQRLLAVTLGPLILAGVLLCTYQLARRRAGIGPASVVERRSAWSRHMAAGLLLTFLVSGRSLAAWSVEWLVCW